MQLKDIMVSGLTYDLLKENGRMDAANHKDKWDGWQEVAKDCGFDFEQRTPAQEAYLDGYYSYVRPA